MLHKRVSNLTKKQMEHSVCILNSNWNGQELAVAESHDLLAVFVIQAGVVEPGDADAFTCSVTTSHVK